MRSLYRSNCTAYTVRVGSTQISELVAGRPVEGTYAVLRKQRRHSRNGDPYLVLELSDPTGRIEGRVWRDADWFDQLVSVGDTVRVVGKPVSWNDGLQLDVRRLEPADAPAEASYLPAARRDLDDLAGELDFLVSEIADPSQRALVEAIWQGAERERLLRSPATVADHHAYLGGLVEHTVAVASLCMAAADRHEHLDRSLLLAAALVHDIGRAREIEAGTSIGLDAEGSLYGHILLGHEQLQDAAGRCGDVLDSAWWPKLVHAVSSHHQPADRCRTAEASALSLANAFDARLAPRH
jgi:3'-5' exoribonuclease